MPRPKTLSSCAFIAAIPWRIWLLGIGVTFVWHQQGLAQELERTVSWKPVTEEQLLVWIREWGESANVEPEQIPSDVMSQVNQNREGELGVCLNLLADWYPFLTNSIEDLNQSPKTQSADELAIDFMIRDPRLPESASIQLQLAVGCWYARHRRYDEALELLGALKTEDVVAPDDLLFYLGLCQHRLLKTDNCATTLKRLLENEQQIPQRFAVLAQLMITDLEKLEPDSLDEVARLMADIRRRQSLHRSGRRVIQQEKDVIAKLDKMIEDLERQMQQSQSSSQQSSSPQPMEQSQNAGGQGSGDVAERQLEEGGAWGNIPPKKRSAVLAEMAKEMPPHYREVIEEYFRQLAKEPKRK